MNDVLFEKQPNNPNSVWKNDIKQELTKVRKKFVYYVIFNFQRNRFKQFLTSDRLESDHAPVMCGYSVSENDGVCTNESSGAQIMSSKKEIATEQPCWLNRIKERHVPEAQRTKKIRLSSSHEGVEKKNSSDQGGEEVNLRAAERRVFCKETVASELQVKEVVACDM